MKDILKNNFGQKIEIVSYSYGQNISIENADTNEVIVDSELYTLLGHKDNFLEKKLKNHIGHDVVILSYSRLSKPTIFWLYDRDLDEIILDQDDVLIIRKDF